MKVKIPRKMFISNITLLPLVIRNRGDKKSSTHEPKNKYPVLYNPFCVERGREEGGGVQTLPPDLDRFRKNS